MAMQLATQGVIYTQVTYAAGQKPKFADSAARASIVDCGSEPMIQGSSGSASGYVPTCVHLQNRSVSLMDDSCVQSV
jgi:hypothetical protein